MLTRHYAPLGLALLSFCVVGCKSDDAMEEHSSMSMDGMSKDDMMKKGDDMVMKGQSMKMDAMKMDAGTSKDKMMMDSDEMIKKGEQMKARALSQGPHSQMAQ